MPTAFDVSSYVISLAEQIGEPVTNMKLQKLLYYSYAWYSVEFNDKLFEDEIQAWKYGPVVPSVYHHYKDSGADNISSSTEGNIDLLSADLRELIDEVFSVYGGKTAVELMNLTHSEAPWRDTYEPDQNKVIPDSLINSYYSSLKHQSSQ